MSDEPSAERLAAFTAQVQAIRDGLHQTVVGQDAAIDLLLTCALTGSHALLVGVPGLAKTLMVKALASAFRWQLSRIQFTPDLMPSDITGYELLSRDETGAGGAPKMVFRHGPIFANLVLADEINRAAPKTPSALLEAMAEKHLTVGGQTYNLTDPFLVVATQNPIEQEGTYPLPEAQLDRFMMEIQIDYPTPAQEEEIVSKTTHGPLTLPSSAFDRESFLQLRDHVWALPVPQSVTASCGSSSCSPTIRSARAWSLGRR
jgi:MoxR-like ATPase